MKQILLKFRSKVQKSEVQAFKFKLFVMLSFMFLYTNYTKGQDYIIRDNISLIDGPTTYIQTNPYPTTTSTTCSLEVGKSFNSLSYRAIFYGGNLGVSQGTTTFGNYGGKWSMTGAYQRGCTPAASSVENGLDFMVTNHLWGNYSTFFGLRADSTAIPSSGPNVIGKRRSAVISWSYERNNTPNRLIFQTIEGIDYGNNGQDNVEHEWATILSNGNIGSGLSAPTAQFQLKPLSTPGTPLLEVLDGSSNPMFTFFEGSIGGVFNTVGQHSITSPTGVTSSTYKPFRVIDKTGTGYEIFSILDNGATTIRSNAAASGTDRILTLKNHSGSDVFFTTDKGLFTIQSDAAASGADRVLNIKNHAANDLFYISDNGNAHFDQGDIFFDMLAGVAGSGNISALYFDNSGKIVPGGTSYAPWETGGNNTTASFLTFGTNDPSDIYLVAGGASIGTIDGLSTASRGFLTYYKPASFGASATPTLDYTLTAQANSSSPTDGPFICYDHSSIPIFKVNNTSFDFLNSTLIISESAGSAYMLGDVIIDGETTLDIVHPFDGTNSHIGFNSTGDYFGNCYADDWLQGSDRRIKNDINDLKYGLNEVLKLKPKTYKLKSDNSSRIGFIAQDVVDIIPEMVTIPQNDSQIYALSYMSMVPVLTKAIQEQQEIINLQKEKLNLLNEKLEILFSNTLVKDDKDNLPKQKEILNQLPVLFQNHPNPFNGFTYVDYFLPPNANNAFLRVVDINGKLIKSFPINNLGYGQIQLDCTNLATGTYYYSLLVNGKSVDTKTMLIAIDN